MPSKFIKGHFFREATKVTKTRLYITIHRKNRASWGKATKCSNIYCPKKSNKYEYALIKGREHGSKREDYVELCHKCHINYDKNTTLKVKFN